VGRKAYSPTDEERKQVEIMASVGIIHEQIAAYLDICADTLTKYYAKELRTSAIKANAKVAGSLYQQAISGNVTAQIFWCKTKMGWKEKSEVEVSGKDGTPLIAIIKDA